jgi:hypothetical protein
MKCILCGMSKIFNMDLHKLACHSPKSRIKDSDSRTPLCDENKRVELYTNVLTIPLTMAIKIESENHILKKALELACVLIAHNDPKLGNDYKKLIDDFMRMADNHGIK